MKLITEMFRPAKPEGFSIGHLLKCRATTVFRS